MLLSQYFGKLWIKIALATAIISWIGIELVIQLTLIDSIRHTRTEIQSHLEHIASLAAHGISGDQHDTAMERTLEGQRAFEQIRDYMRSMRARIDFPEHWYTLLPNSSDTTYFGVMTHRTAFQGHSYIFQDARVRTLFEQVLQQKRTVATDIYRSANGVWLSAMAPIVNRTGKTVAVLEVDMRYEEYLAREESIRTRAMWIRGIGFLTGGLLGMLIGYIIAKPLRIVSKAVQQVAANDFRGNIKVPLLLRFLPDETTHLIVNFNQMASRLDTTMRELRTATERLRTLDHAKTVFLQFIAHELRTPLNALRSLPILREFIADNDAQDVLSGAVASADRLQTFSLAAERYIQALTHTPDFSEPLDIVEVLPYIVEEARLAAPTHDISYSCSAEQLHVCIPYTVLESIVAPVLSNAIKFSPEGCTIAITLAVQGSAAVITIRDPGYGFAAEVADRLFEPFFVAGIEHHSQGTGVNLSIARVLTEHYQGAITARSAGLGSGSTFTLVLPLHKGTQRASAILQTGEAVRL